MTLTLTPAQRADERASETTALWHIIGWDDGLATCEKHWQRPGGLPDGYKKARLRCLAIPVRPRYHHTLTLTLCGIVEILEQR